MIIKTNEQIVTHLLANVGVLAVRAERCGQTEHFIAHMPTAPSNCRSLLEAAMQLFVMFDYKDPLRIIAGDPAISISCYYDYDVAVVVIAPSGHEIHKSLRRMVSRVIAPGQPKPKNRTLVERGDAA